MSSTHCEELEKEEEGKIKTRKELGHPQQCSCSGCQSTLPTPPITTMDVMHEISQQGLNGLLWLSSAIKVLRGKAFWWTN